MKRQRIQNTNEVERVKKADVGQTEASGSIVYFQMRPLITIRGCVRVSVHPSIRPLVTLFLDSAKMGGKWSKMIFHISAGFLFQPFALYQSFNLFFTIIFSQSFLQNLSFFHNLYLTIFHSQSFLLNHSFTNMVSIFFEKK